MDGRCQMWRQKRGMAFGDQCVNKNVVRMCASYESERGKNNVVDAKKIIEVH